jgi:WD40 repeat protein
MLLLTAALLLTQDLSYPHDADVVASTLSPDGETLVALDADGTLVAWQCRPRKRLFTLRHLFRGDSRRRLTCSSDGRLLAISSRELPSSTLVVVSLPDGKERRRFERGFSPAFSPDSEFLACSDGKRVVRWALKSGAELPDLNEAPSELKWVAWSPTGAPIVASTLSSDHVFAWDAVGRGLKLLQNPPYEGPAGSLAIAPDGKSVALGFHWGARIWTLDSAGGSVGLSLEEYSRGDLSYSSDGGRLFSSDHGRQVVAWNLREGKRTLRWQASPEWAGSVEVSARGSFLIWTEGRILRLQSVPSPLGGVEKLRPPVLGGAASNHWITCVGFTPDGKALTGGYGGLVKVWDPESEQETGRFSVPEYALVQFSRDGRLAMFDGGEWGLIIWDLMGKRRRLDAAPDPEIGASAFSPDGKTLGIGRKDGSLTLWDLESGKEKERILTEGGSVTAIAWSPDGKTLAWGTGRGEVVFAEGERGRERVVFSKRGGAVASIGFLNDGRRLLVSDSRGKSLCYEGRLDREPELPAAELLVPADVPDSRWLRGAVGNNIGSARAFSPDGRFAISTTVNGEAMIWRAPWDR